MAKNLRRQAYARIGYDEIKNAVLVLHKLPANINKSKVYRDRSIQEILGLDDVKPMAIKTLKKKIQKLSGLLKWASLRGYIDKNYAEDFRISDQGEDIDDALPFDSDDLKNSSLVISI